METFQLLSSLFLQLAITLLAIDFVSGLVHWAEDTFGSDDTPIYGKWIAEPNTVHHERPAEFTQKTWWESSWDLFLATVLIATVAWWTEHLTWHVIVFCFFGANANQLHKYAHMPASKVPIWVRTLVKLKIIQGAKHHAIHHSGDKNTAYCVITPYLNPMLDTLKV